MSKPDIIPSKNHYRAKLGRAVRDGRVADAAEARRDYYAAKLEDLIRAAIAKAPEFTPEQKSRLRALLAPSTLDGGASDG